MLEQNKKYRSKSKKGMEFWFDENDRFHFICPRNLIGMSIETDIWHCIISNDYEEVQNEIQKETSCY